jgi:hypothetical protein
MSAVREPIWSDMLLWFDTIDAILRGLGHALNNRALALSATIESVDVRRPLGTDVAAGLANEAQKLTEQLRQLRALPFAIEREPMPLLLHDVLNSAIQLHRSHSSVGELSTFLDGSADAPPILVPESAVLHSVLVTLTALKRYASPGGVVLVHYSGTPDEAQVTMTARRDPSDARDPVDSQALIPPMSLAAALLGGSLLEIEQRIGPAEATVTWVLPSLRVMRRRAKSQSEARQ